MILATYLTLLIILVTSLVYSAYAYDLIYEHESYPLCEIEYKTKKIKDRIGLFNRVYHVHVTEESRNESLSSDLSEHPQHYPYSHNVGHIS